MRHVAPVQARVPVATPLRALARPRERRGYRRARRVEACQQGARAGVAVARRQHALDEASCLVVSPASPRRFARSTSRAVVAASPALRLGVVRASQQHRRSTGRGHCARPAPRSARRRSAARARDSTGSASGLLAGATAVRAGARGRRWRRRAVVARRRARPASSRTNSASPPPTNSHLRGSTRERSSPTEAGSSAAAAAARGARRGRGSRPGGTCRRALATAACA